MLWTLFEKDFNVSKCNLERSIWNRKMCRDLELKLASIWYIILSLDLPKQDFSVVQGRFWLQQRRGKYY